MSGDALRREREKRGLTLDDVAEGARIPRRYLVAMEEDDTATLPPGPFLRSYRNQYLGWLGIDPVAFEAGVPLSARPHGDLAPDDLEPDPDPTATIPRSDDLPVGRLVFLAFLLTLSVVLGLRVSSRFADRDAEIVSAPVSAAVPQSVRVRAIEDTRVQVETDNSTHHNGTLSAGGTVDVESALPIVVEVEDLTRVVIHHNGDRIEPLHNLSAPRRLVFVPD